MIINVRNLILIISFIAFYGCSKLPKIDQVLTDKRTVYQKSKDIAVLEVPPDLTITEGKNKAVIPGEAESTTLSEFQRQRDQRIKRGNLVLGTGEAENEQWLALQGAISDLWPGLNQFWLNKNYKTDLNDQELGVLETAWKENGSDRVRYLIFAEPNEQGDTIIFLSSQRQELSEGKWFDSVPDVQLEKAMIRELNRYFYGNAIGTKNTVATTTSNLEPIQSKALAEIIDIGQGKMYLVVQEEFTRSWLNTEKIILQAGYIIVDRNQEKGTYDFIYLKPEGERKKGFLSKLKFWSDEQDEGTPYQLSLTGVGNKTEIIVVNKGSEWETGEDASDILARLRDLYDQI